MRKLALLVLTFSSLAAAPAAAHQSPAGCTTNGLSVELARNATTVRPGDQLQYAVRVRNDTNLAACDVGDANFSLRFPAPDGTATGQTLSWSSQAFAAGKPPVDLAITPYTVAVNANVTSVIASLSGSYVVHDTAVHSNANVTKTLGTEVTRPQMSLTATASPSTGIVPLAVKYDYVLTNTSLTSVPMTDPTVNGANCTPVVRGAGDTNGDDKLDNGEAWHFTCQKQFTVPATYGATPSAAATSGVDGRGVLAGAPATSVTASAPPRPRLTLTKTATPPSGTVPFTATYTYEVYNDSDAAAYPVSDMTINDPGCSPVIPMNADALLSRGERWTYTCALGFTTAGSVFSSAIAYGTDTFDGARIQSAEAGAGVTAEATPPPQTPATVRPDDSLTPVPPLTATPEPAPRAKRAVFQLITGRFARPCTGRVVLTLKVGKKIVARKTVKLDRYCRYRATFDVLRSRLGSARSVTITARLGKKTITQRRATPS